MVLKLEGHRLVVHVGGANRSVLVSPGGESRRRIAAPRDLVREADLVLVCLADIASGREFFLGEEGVVDDAVEGKIFVDHGTVDLATSRDLHAACEAQGAGFLDAPISGGPEGANAGTLAIMAGGEPDVFERVRPVFDAMGSKVVHMGPAGACLLYTSPSPRDKRQSRMPSSA